MNIFTYGSLMFPEVMYGLVKQPHYESSTAVLDGHSRKQVKGKPYPGLIVDPGNSVRGRVYFNVNEEDTKILHDFEDKEYHQVMMHMKTENGKEISALVYLYADPMNLEEREWDL